MTVGHLRGGDPNPYTRGKKWLGTFTTKEEATRAYDVAAVRYFRSQAKLNLLIVSRDADFITPPVKVASRDEDKEHRKDENQLAAEGADAVYMVELLAKNPQLLVENQTLFESKDNDEMFAELFLSHPTRR